MSNFSAIKDLKFYFKKNILLCIFMLLFILISCNTKAQNKLAKRTLNSLTIRYQSCLDKGEAMLLCSINYYRAMDSCLNVKYNELISAANNKNKKTLELDQRNWQNLKTKKFDNIENQNKMQGKDGEMIRLNEKAIFIKERVLKLLST